MALALTAAGLVTGPAPPAAACVVLTEPGESEADMEARLYREADLVFEGVAIRADEATDHTNWTFNVEKAFKGPAEDGTVVRSEYTSTFQSSCAVRFVAGRRYRVLARMQDGQLVASNLGTRELPPAAAPSPQAPPAKAVPGRPTFTG